VRRAESAAPINAIANHPSVRRYIGFLELGNVDFAPVIAGPGVLALISEGGAAIFVPCGDDSLEAHVMFLPHVRGAQVERVCRAMFDWLFANTPCREVIGPCPIRNRAVVALATRLGMKRRGIVSPPVPMSPFVLFSMTRADWKR